MSSTTPAPQPQEDKSIPVIEERLELGTRVAETGRGVRIHKTVTEQPVTIDERLAREELEVRHVPVDRIVAADQAPSTRYEGDTLVVPVLEEVLVVERRLRIKEELHITRVRRQERFQDEVMLKSEQVHVERFDESGEPREPREPPEHARPARTARTPAGGMTTTMTEETTMQHTLVAVFDERTDAQNAMNELLSSGFSRGEVRLSNADPTGQTDSATGESDIAGDRDLAHDRAGDSSSLGITASIKHFFSDLFGSDNPDHVSRYEGAVTRGHHVLTVTADSLPEVERAADIIERYGPTDIDEQASGFGEVPSGAGAMRMGTSSGMHAAPMSAQSSSTPSSSSPSTSSSSSSLQGGQGLQNQQALDNPGDRKLFQQQSLNQAEPMGTTYQEPMGKSGLGATGGTSLHGSTIQENPVQGSSLEGTPQGLGMGGSVQGSSTGNPIRSDSQQYAGGAAAADGAARLASQQRGGSRIYSRGGMGQSGYSTGSDVDDDTYFREHFSSTYGAGGGSYDDYAPAYRYGSQMRGDSRYSSRAWDEVEPELRSDWETRNPNSAWERMKSAVRRGWDRMARDDDQDYYRSHFTSNYAGSGKTYDEYEPAYSYGSEMARSNIYRNRPWDEAMPSLRNDWETRTAGSTAAATGSAWEDMKDAVRHGWNRMTGGLSADDDSEYRKHYTATYGASGESYDTYRPAYEYGSAMHRNPQYSNRAWDDELENELRSGWQSRYPGGPSTWDKVKEAVRHGWNRLTY